jgi:transcriptional regulator with XRE-family HTH domain
MQDLIKKIRQSTGYSQTEFAEKLGIQFATINRWENAHSVPNRLAQEKLYELCEQMKVPVYDMIMEKIKAQVDEIKKEIDLDKGKILLYHGSKNGLSGSIAPISRDRCDFGKGFYMGTTPEQSLTLICDFEDSKFYVVSMDVTDLNSIEVPEEINWAMLVAFHRGKMERIKGTAFYNRYANLLQGKDIAIGSIANDRMFFVIDNFFQENITDVALIHSLSALQLGKQYVALTQAACDKIKIEKQIELSYFEKKVLQKVSKENRQKGIEYANAICKTYRREGKFFDEILEEATKGDE